MPVLRPLIKQLYEYINVDNADKYVIYIYVKLRSGEHGKWTNHKTDKRIPKAKLKVKDTFR